jgi:phosphatidylinositol alpha-1,6-mannosyltransferase
MPHPDETEQSLPLGSKPLILVTHEFFPHRGGIAVYAAEMARAAHESGYDVEVWAPALPPGTSEAAWPFKVLRLPIAGDHSLQSQWRMALHLRNRRDQLQHAILYIPEPGPLLALLLLQFFERLHTAGLVITFHGSEIQRLASRRALHWSTKHLLPKAHRIGVVSHFAEQLLLKHFPCAHGKVVITPGALRSDISATEPAPAARSLTSDKTIILTVARLNPRKGQLQVITALKALPSAQQASIEYWLVGCHTKDNYDDLLRAAAASAAFPVKFLGDVPDAELSEVYARADIFAMTSMPHKQSVEGFGLVYLEAGARGLPVIAHDIGGVAEAVVHEKTGLLVTPGDTAALTNAFARLISDRSLREQFGRAGRVRAVQHTWKDSVHALFGDITVPSPSSSS